nr:LysM domain-containing protein [Ligilactobacillus acidipiscis]
MKLPATTTKKKQKSESANTKKYKNKGTTKSDKQGNKSTYTVKTGDSIGSIADHFGVSVAAIQAENPDVDFSVVNPGQTIKLPK